MIADRLVAGQLACNWLWHLRLATIVSLERLKIVEQPSVQRACARPFPAMRYNAPNDQTRITSKPNPEHHPKPSSAPLGLCGKKFARLCSLLSLQLKAPNDQTVTIKQN
jgi:hypothetical protein